MGMSKRSEAGRKDHEEMLALSRLRSYIEIGGVPYLEQCRSMIPTAVWSRGTECRTHPYVASW